MHPTENQPSGLIFAMVEIFYLRLHKMSFFVFPPLLGQRKLAGIGHSRPEAGSSTPAGSIDLKLSFMRLPNNTLATPILA